MHVQDASTSPTDAGAVGSEPREFLRIGSTNPDRNVFEVEANSGTWIDLVDGEPQRRRCKFVGEVIGVSANGRVALQSEPDYVVTIVDLATSCEPVKTSIKSNSQNSSWDGSSSSNGLSDDGSRIAIGAADANDSANVFAVSSGDRLFNCVTHSPAGGPSAEHGISGDGRGVTWTHGREGTWVEELGKCGDDRRADLASSTSYFALVSPHRKFLVECPFHDWGTDVPHLGFDIESLGKSRTRARLDTKGFADDDFDFCATHKSAFSPDDTLLAFEDGFRVHIYSLATHDQRMQIGESALSAAMAGEVRALAFADMGTLLIASDTQIVRVDLREHVFVTVDIDDTN